MWLIKIEGGIELTEADLGCWDNVPANAEIEALAFDIPRDQARPYIVEYKNFERYCCARIANSATGLAGKAVGYSVAVEKGGMVFEHDIFADGMRLQAQAVARTQIPERCWRRGFNTSR